MRRARGKETRDLLLTRRRRRCDGKHRGDGGFGDPGTLDAAGCPTLRLIRPLVDVATLGGRAKVPDTAAQALDRVIH